MLAPNLLAYNFATAMRALLPHGRAWPRGDDSVLFALLKALGFTFERNTARANNLLVDSFPPTTLELLPEWEATLGLPDPCAGQLPTIAQRQAQVGARFANTGGQSAAYFIKYALQLGYAINVKNFAPFRAGRSRAGDPDCGIAWANTWAVIAPLNSIIYFRAGIGAAGEPLASWSNTVLECQLNEFSPAHTVLLFEYE